MTRKEKWRIQERVVIDEAWMKVMVEFQEPEKVFEDNYWLFQSSSNECGGVVIPA